MPVLGGRYRLADRLGEGGMSVVWRGHDEVLDRPVAVKVLDARHAAVDASRARIQAEARAAARLSHPHINQVYDYGEARDQTGTCMPYIVMELLTGHTLAARLRAGPLPVPAALRVCAQVASALAAAHRQGLVHRDVKPGNIMLTPAGPKVVDFGIAAAAGDPAGSAPEGDVLGTPAYVAPERLTEGQVLPASDVYGLGLVLYRALTGEPPWRTGTVTELLDAHKYAPPAPLPPVEGLPAAVVDLCHRCLAKDPAHRPTAEEMAWQLADAGGWQVVSTAGDLLVEADAPVDTPGNPGGRSGRWRVGRVRTAVAAAAAAVLCAGALGGFWALGDRSGSGPGLDGVAALPESADPSAAPGAPGGAGATGGAAPDPEPSQVPSPVSVTGSGSGEPGDYAVETPVGTLVLRCDGTTAVLVSSDLLPGVGLSEAESAAGTPLDIELSALRREVQVSVRCEVGRPVPSVDIS